MWAPVSLAVFGGLTTSTFLTLVILPSVFSYMDDVDRIVRAIFRWLAEEVSPDTFVNLMAQYRPEYRVGTPRPGAGGEPRYREIDRRPEREELSKAYEMARDAGLWRFDERWLF